MDVIHYSDWQDDTAGNPQDLIQLVDIVLTHQARRRMEAVAVNPEPVLVQCKFVFFCISLDNV